MTSGCIPLLVCMENPMFNHLHLHWFGGLAEREIQARVKQKDHMTVQKTWGKDKHDTQIHLIHCIGKDVI